MIEKILAVLIAYLIGSIPSGYLIGKAFGGDDLRKKGSGSIGMTNVLRNLGKLPAALTLLSDGLKGLIVAHLAIILFPSEIKLIGFMCVSVVVGNCWSAFIGFKGGKGVTHSFGIFLRIAPKAALIALFFWLAAAIISRYASVGAITFVISNPILIILFSYPSAFFWASIIISLIVLYRHRENIVRLVNGEEKKIGKRIAN